MKWGVETKVNKARGIVELSIEKIYENSPFREYHSPDYDMTFWDTHDEAVANLNQCQASWQRHWQGEYEIRVNPG